MRWGVEGYNPWDMFVQWCFSKKASAFPHPKLPHSHAIYANVNNGKMQMSW